LSGLNQWLGFCPGAYLPSGSSKALKGAPLIVPETIVIPRDGSFAEAVSGSLRMIQEFILYSLASKSMVDISLFFVFFAFNQHTSEYLANK
jgi:hypothetical protein